jgi:serine/threonine-protein kinase
VIVAELRDQLQISLGTAYAVERELGGGGMSRVFVAEELALGRRVVIKVLPDEIAHAVSVERFQREIALAAKLAHPHIVPLLSAGDADGRPYYVMPYVDGETLRARMARSPLGIAETVRLLRQIVSALGAAHAKGIVHRDIKPENVLLTGDAASITDFGVAKALATATASDRSRDLTDTGLALGTPAYMAPEQALGDSTIDARADFYALGCVAYELLTGATPFKGTSSAQLVAAHVHQRPTSIHVVRPDVPAPLARLVMRCLEKDPGQRPPDAESIARDLDSIPLTRGSAATIGSSRPRRTMVIGIAALAVLLVGAYVARRGGPATVRTPILAVLPLDNEGPDSTRYFVDGLAAAISDRLAGVSTLRVIDHQSAASVAKKATTAKEMGAALGAEFVLRGAVRWDLSSAEKRGELTVNLVSVSDGTSRWHSDPIPFTPASNPFDVQRQVALSVAEALDVALSPQDRATLAERPTENAAAFDAYLRGISTFEQTVTAAGTARAAEYMVEAAKLDSGFLLARARWLDYAINLTLSSPDGPTIDSLQRVVDYMKRRAPSDVNTLLADAQLAQFKGDVSAAQTPLKRALEVAPNNPFVLVWNGFERLSFESNWLGSWPMFERAARLAPRNLEILQDVAQSAMMMRRIEDARSVTARALAIDHDNLPFAFMSEYIAAATGDSDAVLRFYDASLALNDRPASMLIPPLLYGPPAARDSLIHISLGRVALAQPRFDSITILYAQGLAWLERSDSARARLLFQRANQVSEAAPLAGNTGAGWFQLLSRIVSSAAVGNRSAADAGIATVRGFRVPAGSGAATLVACTSAEAFALLRDTTEMYPALEHCIAGPSGWPLGVVGYFPAMLKRYPPYAPYVGQPHFRRLIDSMPSLAKPAG